MRKLISKSDNLSCVYLHWSSMALLESNRLFGGWSGFDLGSTPLQSK